MSLEVEGGTDVGGSEVDSKKNMVGKEDGNDVQVKKAQASSIRRIKSGDDSSTRKKREDPSTKPSPSASIKNVHGDSDGQSTNATVDSNHQGVAAIAGNRNQGPQQQQHHIIHHSDISTPALRGLLRQVEKSLYSTKTEEQLIATKKIRQLLSVEREYLIDDVIAHDLIPRLLGFLKREEVPELQVEALWALTNVAAGSTDHTRVLIQKGAIPALVGLMSSSNDEVLEQAVWVLGNLAGDGPPARDKVLREKALMPLLKIINESKRLSLQRISTWALSNICDGQPQAYASSATPFNLQAVLACLVRIIGHEDTEVVSHVCWALSHLCDGPSRYVDQVVRSQVCQPLVKLLEHRSWRVTKPALRTIGNIVCAEDDRRDYTQYIVELNAVDRLEKLVAHSNREIQKEACWTLSNIAAGSEQQIQHVISSGVIPVLISLISDQHTDADVKVEACWVILNATSCGSGTQIEVLAKCGCVDVLCKLLGDRSMAGMALEGLEKVLKVGEYNITRASAEKVAKASNKGSNGSGNSSKGKKKSKGSADDVNSNSNDSGSNKNGVSPEPNRHARLIDVKQIELLRKSGDPNLAKRASMLWNSYYIQCAICSQTFEKNAKDSFFCTECKCMVCTNCDCTKFHLSYQLSQWDEMYAEEEAEKSSKAKAKKKKKKKKKQREKEKKKANNTAKPEVDDDNQEEIKVGVKSVSLSPNMKKPAPKNPETAAPVPAIDILDTKYNNEVNDNYVDYLAKGGSIFELAKMLDDDGGM